MKIVKCVFACLITTSLCFFLISCNKNATQIIENSSTIESSSTSKELGESFVETFDIERIFSETNSITISHEIPNKYGGDREQKIADASELKEFLYNFKKIKIDKTQEQQMKGGGDEFYKTINFYSAEGQDIYAEIIITQDLLISDYPNLVCYEICNLSELPKDFVALINPNLSEEEIYNFEALKLTDVLGLTENIRTNDIEKISVIFDQIHISQDDLIEEKAIKDTNSFLQNFYNIKVVKKEYKEKYNGFVAKIIFHNKNGKKINVCNIGNTTTIDYEKFGITYLIINLDELSNDFVEDISPLGKNKYFIYTD